MLSTARTLSACLASAEEHLHEQPLRLAGLVGEEVAAVEPHPHGIRFRFGSGATFIIPCGTARDAAGLPVIEP